MATRATASRVAAAIALATAIGGASAMAATNTVTLEAQNPDAYGPHEFSYDIDVDRDVTSEGTLIMTIIGDFDGAMGQNESVFLDIDGFSLGTAYASRGVSSDKCKLINFTVAVSQDLLREKAKDGKVNFTFSTLSDVSAAANGGPCIFQGVEVKSAYIQGVFTYQTETKSKKEVLEETVSTAGSLSNSRRTVTLASLPRLSRRLGKVSFSRPSPGGALPRPSAPSSVPSRPSVPSAPTSGSASTGGGGSGVISGSGTADRGYFSFSGDLRGMRQAASMSFNEADGSAAQIGANTGASPIDVWFGGSYTYFESETGAISQTGDIATAQVGVDARLSDSLLVGAAAFGDLLISDVSNDTETAGLGFMTGPYFVAALDGPLFLEGLAAIGRAYNRIVSPDAADARYESDRLLLTARLSGDWTYDAWSFRPSTRITYYAEKQESFEDSAGSTVPEDTSILGQIRFGPEIGYTLDLENASARPYVSVEGIWSFRQSDQLVDGAIVSPQDLSGGLAFGLDGRWGDATFRAGGRVEGVGDDATDSYTGELTVRMPLD